MAPTMLPGTAPVSPDQLNPRDPLGVFAEQDKEEYGLTDRRPAVRDKIGLLVDMVEEVLKPSFAPKTRVLLKGLAARADLNGKLGEVVTELPDSGRVRVKLLTEPDAEEEEKKEETLAVKPQNLEVIKAAGAAEADGAENTVPKWGRFCFSITMNSFTQEGANAAVPSNGDGYSGPRSFPKDVRLRAPAEYLLDDADGASIARDIDKDWWRQPYPKQRKIFVLPLEHHGQAAAIKEASLLKEAKQAKKKKKRGKGRSDVDQAQAEPGGVDGDDKLPGYTYHPKVVENYEARVAKFDNYEWLVDCYRLRLDDEVYWCVGNTYNAENGGMKIPDSSGRPRKFYPNRRGLYAQARSQLELKKLILLDLALFLGLAAKKRLLPADFSTEAFLANARKENKLVTPFSKTMAIDKYGGENVFSACRSLRRTGEDIYGTSLADLSGNYLYNILVRDFRDSLHLERPPPEKWVESERELELEEARAGEGEDDEDEEGGTSSAVGKSGSVPGEGQQEPDQEPSAEPSKPVWFVLLLQKFFSEYDLNPMKQDNVKQLWETNFLKHPEFVIPAELVERCATLAENIKTESYAIKVFSWEEERMPALFAYLQIHPFFHFLVKKFKFVLEFCIDDFCVFATTNLLGVYAGSVARLHKITMGKGEEELVAFAAEMKAKYEPTPGAASSRAEDEDGEPDSPPGSGSSAVPGSGNSRFSPASRNKNK
eukprot:g13574.t1